MNHKLSRGLLISFGLFLLTFSGLAAAEGLDTMITEAVTPFMLPFVNAIFYSVTIPGLGIAFPLIVGWLVIAATVFTIYFGFVQFRHFGHSIALVSGKYADPNDAGEVSHFQALATALSGTVGLGNIAGVAVAVSIGGAGATFWMILAGLLGMASKFTECTLGVKYRNEYEDGTVSGGPMYYLSKGLSEQGKVAFGKFLAIMFAIFCILGSWGGGNMFQANQAHVALVGVTGGDSSFLAGNGWITGVVLAAIVFAVIVGGLQSIARVTEKVVPFMALLYVTAAVVILIVEADRIGWAFGQIIDGAFTGLGVAGGIVGALIQGFKRAAFSNEAGVGSAAIAHSAVRTKEPITEGYVSLLEPFIDTVVICTMTALVIVISGVLNVDPATNQYILNDSGTSILTQGNLSGVDLTAAAFATGISWFPNILAVAVLLFAFSTMISWSYYGLKAWTYLFGEGKVTELIFKVLFCVFVVIGAAMNLGIVIDFSDAAIFAMALVNIIGLYFLMPVVKAEMNSYNARRKSGEIRRFK
jgi:AGCS family alanine or glycine:cation symporter